MSFRLHRGGRLRRWLGQVAGGDAALGDRIWRRVLHMVGAGVLLYYVLPTEFFLVLSLTQLLLLGLAVLLVLEALRLARRLEIPTIRPFEHDRPGSYVFYGISAVIVILFLPETVAVVVLLGTAFVDPLIGELRLSQRWCRWYPALPGAVYATMALVVLVRVGGYGLLPSAALAVLTAAIAIAVERPRHRWLDDDLLMTLVPAAALAVFVLEAPALLH